MSQQLLDYVHDFLSHTEEHSAFSNSFIHCWKKERDEGKLLLDDPKISEALSSIFCLADLFNADENREEYELDADGLKAAISNLLETK